MGKVLEFKQTAASLLSAGTTFFDRECYGDAIDCFYRAHLKDTKNERIMCSLGEAYLAINDPMQAASWYLRALNEDDGVEDVYTGLVRCYGDMGYDMREAAYYYFAMGKNHGIVTPDEIEYIGDLEDDYDADGDGRQSRADSVNDTVKFQRAQAFMRENALSAAYILFGSVSGSDSHYADARRMMMKIDYERGRYSDAAELADELLAENDCDTQALIYGAASYDRLGVHDKRDAYYERAEIDKDTSCDDMETLAQVAWYMSRYDDAIKIYRSIKNFLPYDRDILMQLAMCYANVGDKDSAKSYIIDVCRLYPDDLALKYYADRIDGLDGKADFEPLDTVPESEAIRREDELDDFMVKHGSVSAATQAFKKSPEMTEYLEWLFQEGDRGLQMSIGGFLAQGKRWRPFCERQLISPYVNEQVKKKILLGMFDCDPVEVGVTTSQLYRKIKYDPPEELWPFSLEVYSYTFVCLLFFGDGYLADLDDVYKQLNHKLFEMRCASPSWDIPALAAAICYRCNLTREKLSKSDCLEIFDCDRDKFEEYIDCELFDDVKKLRKSTRAKSKRRELR